MKKEKWKRYLLVLLCVCAVGLGSVLGMNAYVLHVTGNAILTPERAAGLPDVDCILVLGCQVWADGRPSGMLEDRLKQSIELYELGAAPKLLMSGDHGREEYNEVGAMKEYAISAGVPSEDVFMDHAGFSTYESIYRAKEIFGADRIIIVTQEYHLYRALYIAQELGVEAYGVSSDLRTYGGQVMRECREVLARCKDCIGVLFKPLPTYLGDPIPLSGNGDRTNDPKSCIIPEGKG